MIVILFLIIPLINDSKEERTRIEKLEKQVEYQQILIEELTEQK